MTSNFSLDLVKKSRSLVCRSQKLRTEVSCTLAMVSRSQLSNYTNKTTLVMASNQRISVSSKPTNLPQIEAQLVLTRRYSSIEHLLIKYEDNAMLQTIEIDGQRLMCTLLFVTYVSKLFFFLSKDNTIEYLIPILQGLISFKNFNLGFLFDTRWKPKPHS